MIYELNGNEITREKLITKVDSNYVEYLENVAKNLFLCGCYEFTDIKGKQTITIYE